MAATEAGKILITEAKRGLGLEMIKQLSENSCPNQHIFAACHDPDVPNSESKELARKHPSVITIIRLDADDPSSVKDFAKKVGSLLGNNGLNQLVNNADRNRKLIEIESIVKSFKATNCNLPVWPEYLPYLQMAAKASGTPGMSSNKAAVMKIFSVVGSISTMPSIYEQFPTLPYGASKAGCNMLTVLAAEEFKADEILCIFIDPGCMRMDMGGDTALESMEGILRVIDSLTEKQHAVLQTTCKLIL
uniref:Zgc:92161 n=1 Tax=Cyprinus carpio TaxID=7962 RepID=A0A8C2Q9E9_CYPCA